MSATVAVSCNSNWALITINREAKRNALDRSTRNALHSALNNLAGKAKAIVLTGTGNSFCAGLDLKEVEADRLAGTGSTAGQEWIDLNLAIRSHPAIFIAAVNGVALGGGVTLINTCDLAVASSSATIGCPELGFARFASLAGPTSQLTISRKRAAWLLLTTNRIDALTAERWGMVNEVTEAQTLQTRASQIATQLASFDEVALAETKHALEKISSGITGWREAMEFGQTVNERIRKRSAATLDGPSCIDSNHA